MFNTINKKFLLAFGATILLLMTIFAVILINLVNKNLILELEKNLQTQTQSYYKTVELYNDTLEKNSITLINIFEKSFRKLQIKGDLTTKINGVAVKNIYNGFASLNNNFHPVDLFTEQTQAVASVYVKENDAFVSVTSSLIRKNGERDLLHKITPDSKIYKSLEKNEQYVSLENFEGESYISAYKPIEQKGKIVGALFVGYKFTDGLIAVEKKLKEVVIGKTGFIYILDEKGKLIVHKTLEGKNVYNFKDKDGNFYIKEILEKNEGVIHYDMLENNKSREKIAAFKKYDKWGWTIVLSSYEDEFLDISKKVGNLFIIGSIILTIIFLSIVFVLVNKLIANPLEKFESGLLNFFKFVNKESKDAQLIEINSNDEIGTMAKVINENINFTKKAINEDIVLINEVKTIIEEVNKGYLDKKINAITSTEMLNELKDLINEMLSNLKKFVGDDLNTLVAVLDSYGKRDFTKQLDKDKAGIIGKEISNMNNIITQMLISSQNDGITLEKTSKELSTNVSTLSANATNQAASLEEVAASITEVTENINNTSQKAQNMFNLSSTTKESSSKGKELASKTVSSMDEINEKVQTINESINIIDQIAFQTNILSLNAAVEAATAGEAGKGFAVVAQEVRNLAARSAEAASEIKQLVESATIQTQEGKTISSNMINGFEELEEKINETNQMINDVAYAAKEQTEVMLHISDTINNLDKFTQENAQVAEKTNEIAIDTNSIASKVVQNASESDFIGKK